jgi:radical SAM superfamily enzyme YgiQ (UPF0313 family)|tara:strand:+ start:3692 stop:5137 length:1446 start_codon:yes stop_codon:yes gene_type:complete
MKIALLNPPHKFRVSRSSRWPEHTKSGTLYYPFWLAHATGVIQETNHDPLLLDSIANGWGFQKTIKNLDRFNPDLLVLETSTPTLISDLKFAQEYKNEIGGKVAIVGTHVSALPEETLRLTDAVDFVFRNEFDYTTPELAGVIEKKGKLRDVQGISYKQDGRIINNPNRKIIQDLDALPFVSPVYNEFLNIQDYRYALARHPMIQIKSSRGCPNACTFCNVPQTFTYRKYKTRSPNNFVTELEWVNDNLPNVKEIFIEDDTFTINKQRVLDICRLIKNKNLDLTWSANARADVPLKVLKTMKDAGCRMLIIGYESGNQKILNNVNKGINLNQANEFTKNAKKAGIRIFGCFMIGLPGDTKKTIEETFQFAKKLSPDMIQIEQAVPFPGTEFYTWCKDNGYLITEDYENWLDKNGQLSAIVSYPELSDGKIKKMRDDLTMRFYTSPRIILRTVMNNLTPSEFERLANASMAYLSYLVKKRLS